MRWSVTCSLFGHDWLPWSYNGVRSRRVCRRCGRVERVPEKDNVPMTQDEANRIIEAARDRRDAMERAVARDDALKVAQDHAAEAEECAAVIQTALAEPAPAHEGWFAAKLAADRFPREVALATMWAKIAEALR